MVYGSRLRNFLLTSVAFLLPAGMGAAADLPAGGSFTAGTGTVTTTGTSVTVDQATARGIVTWQSFSVGAGKAVRINNGAGATLSRVTGGEASAIDGSVTASGSLYLVNPNGVVVGPSGTVTTGGTFVASTHDVTDDAFLAGGPMTFKGDSAARVENLGRISSTGGSVYLIARAVSNKGTVAAPHGTAGMAGGQEVLLTESAAGGERVLVRVGPGMVDNQGTIEAAQAELKAAGGNVYALAGNNGGVIRATGDAVRDGAVWLVADDGHAQNTGTIAATNADGSGGAVTVKANGAAAVNTGTLSADGTRGGTVTVKAGRASNQGRISADGATGAGGAVTVAVEKTYVATSGSALSARGRTTGGRVTVAATAADSTLFSSGAQRADGGDAGGSVDLFAGTINLVDATVDASGGGWGGSVRIGGDYQGTGGMLKAATTLLSPTTSVRADATGPVGTGGRIIVWSEEKTGFHGSLSARGGSRGGDGGLIEVSSHDILTFAGTADAGATHGVAGSLLLDPKNIVISDGADGAYPQFQYIDPNPASGNNFGNRTVVLPSGNVIVTASGDDFAGSNAGAVYLYGGLTGALISTLNGASAGDAVGTKAPTVLSSGNFIVATTGWRNGTATWAGAATWGSGVTGVAGLVSSANSLVGSSRNDLVGGTITTLSNGNYLVAANNWTNGTALGAGAVTWGSGTAGVAGVVSAANSLVSTSSNDGIASSITTLPNGNYLVVAKGWTNGTATSAGAVIWGSGTAGVSGAISATNALVGSSANDMIGGTITTLTNGNYVVTSTGWTNGTAASVGAATWVDGSSAWLTGLVSSTNSLVGSSTGDKVGGSITTLANGNYVVSSGSWANGTATSAGAVTWGSGTAGVTGTVSSANSLVGSANGDGVGSVTTLTNGNYVVVSQQWGNGTATWAGAVTWSSGTVGVVGVVSSTNSLVGSSLNDKVGSTLTTLSNGNYVVQSNNWKNGTMAAAGMAAWGSGTAGVVGVVSATNSLIGTAAYDNLGTSVTVLSNGNYVVSVGNWANGTALSAGAVTWVNGTVGLVGTVTATNSLVGSSTNDAVGSVTALANGNYLVTAYRWNNGTAASAGAVTWVNGTTGLAGTVSSTNSLVGSATGDRVGSWVMKLAGGDYLVISTNWNNGTAASAGAVTWGSGTAGLTGTLSSANSLIGSSANDKIGSSIKTLSNGNYLVVASNWANGTAASAGAVTWISGTAGASGVVSATNSLIGTAAGDKVGTEITTLSNGNYLVGSAGWANGTATSAGAVTWGSGTAGVIGVVSSTNSLVGSSANDGVGGVLVQLTNGNYLAFSGNWNNGAATSAGAVTWGSGTAGVIGVVSAANSLVGTSANDQIGISGIFALSDGNYVVGSFIWNNGTVASAGAVTWGSGTAGISGTISAANSLVGSSTADKVGDIITPLSGGAYAIGSPAWSNGTATSAGAVTWVTGTAGMTGVVSAANSIVGAVADGKVGYNIPILNTASGTLVVPASTDGTGGRVYVAVPVSLLTYATATGQTVTIRPSAVTGVLDTGTALTLQASNDITVNGAITVNNPSGNGGALTLQAGRSILLNAGITTDNGALILIANDLLANGVIDAQRETGNAVITMAAGTAIDAGTGAVSIELRSGAGKTHSASGTITLGAITAGTLSVLNQGITAYSGIALNGGALTVSGTGDALVLAADNGVFNNAGLAVLSAANGRFLIYSADQPTTTLGGLTPGIITGQTYASYAPASVTETGDQIIYGNGIVSPPPPPPPPSPPPSPPETTTTTTTTTTPASTLSFSATALSIVYGDLLPAFTYTYAGLQGGDSLSSVISGTPVVTSIAASGSGVGTYTITVDLSGVRINSGYNYVLGSTSATLTITPRTLTASGSRVYDGTTGFASSLASLSGLVGSDVVALSGTGTLADKDAGSGKAVSGLSLTGAAAANYTLGGVSATIGRAVLAVTALTEGKTAGAGDPLLSYSVSGLQGADSAAQVLSGGLSRTGGEGTGSYLIGQGSLAANANYSIVFTGATFTVLAPAATRPTVTASTVTAPAATLPVIATPLTVNTAGSVLGSSSTAASLLSNAMTAPAFASAAPGTNAQVSAGTGVFSGGGAVTIDASRGIAAAGGGATGGAGTAGGGGQVENSLSAGGFQVVFSQPANFTPALADAGGGTASVAGASGEPTLAFASSFTTFRADDAVNSAVVDGAGSGETDGKPQGANQ